MVFQNFVISTIFWHKFILFFWDNYSKPTWGLACLQFAYPWFKTLYFAHLNFNPLPTFPFAVILEKNKYNKDKKVRVFYCLKTSMRTNFLNAKWILTNPHVKQKIYRSKEQQKQQGQGQRCQNWPSLVSSPTWFLNPIIFTITPRTKSQTWIQI